MLTRSIALLILIVIAFAAASVRAPNPPRSAAAAPPNILIIVADDLGYGDPRCYNPESKIPTPHIDTLAREGMRFTDAHSTSAVCTPTRYALLTGRYSWRGTLKRGVLQGYDPLLIEPGRETIASLLKKRGYSTACIGKWHLGLGNERANYDAKLLPGPNSVGFDYFFGIPSSLDFPPYVFVKNDEPIERPTGVVQASASQREGGGGFWRAGGIAPGFRHADVLPTLTEKAVDFIQKQERGRPFFLYLPLASPHTPWMPSESVAGRSGAGPYGDFVVQTDESVGRVLAALKARGLERDTLVVFTSDNGAHWLPEDIARYGHRANADWRGQKADIYEGGHRVPFIARWPSRIRAGSNCDRLIGLVDLFATSADAAGAKVPDSAGEDSISISPLLFEKARKTVRESLVHHSGDGMFAVRSGRWKLIQGLGSGGFTPPRAPRPEPGGPEGQLYDLAADPREQSNLYQSRPAEVARLKTLLNEARDKTRTVPARPAAGKKASRPPNVVIVYADDLGWFDIGFNGNRSAATPNLDRLAREGMRFSSFYVAQPVCSASRAALLTGCYPNRVGILGALGPASKVGISPFELSMAEMFKQQGYSTAIYGKWHLGYQPQFLPTRHGFDEYFGLPYSNDMWPKHPTNRTFPPLPLIDGERTKELNPDQSNLTRWYAERAVGFIKQNRDRPFFLYVPHSMPHVPIFASERFRGKSGRGLYHEVIQEIDWSVGEILDTLKKEGLEKETLVIFTSDNGPWLSYGNHAGSAGRLREGKATVFEGGVRVPFAARWPGRIPRGKTCDEPAMTIDLLPTLAGLIGSTLPGDRTIDGMDIWPLLSGKRGARSPHEALYFYWNRGLEAVRSGKWKLHFPHPYQSMAGPPGKDGSPNGYVRAQIELSLYDLKADPSETTNLADKRPEEVRRIRALADKMRADLGDTLTGVEGKGARPSGRAE